MPEPAGPTSSTERPAELQTAELNGADSAAGDDFGAAVGVGGAIAVVGSPERGGIGSAYVFTQASS